MPKWVKFKMLLTAALFGGKPGDAYVTIGHSSSYYSEYYEREKKRKN
jgi:hypothetical protein